MKYVFFIVFCFLFFIPAAAQQQFSVYFESDKYELTSQQDAILEQWIKSNPEIKVVGIHGFCDEDGTSGYNDTLAKNRINFVFKKITGRIRIRDDFKTRSFGELHQLSKNKGENRKVTLFYLEPKELVHEDEILGIKPAIPVQPKKERRFPEKISVKNPNGTSSEYKLDVEFMKKIDEAKAGEKLQIDNLNFQINTFAVMPESRGKMYELLIVMQDNPDLKINIQGHLCCMPIDRVDLSTQRAKAIYNFLVGNDIDKSRLSYKGFGSTQPIFPLPEKSEAERAANRRVEILIVEN